MPLNEKEGGKDSKNRILMINHCQEDEDADDETLSDSEGREDSA